MTNLYSFGSGRLFKAVVVVVIIVSIVASYNLIRFQVALVEFRIYFVILIVIPIERQMMHTERCSMKLLSEENKTLVNVFCCCFYY